MMDVVVPGNFQTFNKLFFAIACFDVLGALNLMPTLFKFDDDLYGLFEDEILDQTKDLGYGH